MYSNLCLYSRPNRRASALMSVSQPQLGYSTNGGTAGNVLIGSGGGNDSSLRKEVINSISGNTANNNSGSSALLLKQHGGTCEQSTQTPESIMHETRRHKLKAFKFSLNSVTTPALNLRWAPCKHAYTRAYLTSATYAWRHLLYYATIIRFVFLYPLILSFTLFSPSLSLFL